MPPRQELSQDQIQEIRALRGRLSAAEAKKRFGIGSTRLYKIWSESGAEPPPEPKPAGSLSPYGELLPQEQRQRPTVEDFYERLGRLEAKAEQSTKLLAEVLAQLAQCNEEEDALLDEVASQEAEEACHEDLQKVGQMVETTQKWIYISLAAVFALKVVGAAWKRCTPVRHDVGPAPPVENTNPQDASANPGDPFYMEG